MTDRITEVHVELQEETYLGDAVYASFDGWMILLRNGDGNNNRIFLEPEVLTALFRFAKTHGYKLNDK